MATYEERYKVWKAKVDEAMISISGVRSEEIYDWDYASAFDDGTSPRTAARQALKAADFPSELL